MMHTMVLKSRKSVGQKETRMPRKLNAQKAKRHTMSVVSVRAS